MIPCFCVDDKNKPREIPEDKWVKKGEEYRITAIYVHPMQGHMQGVTLAEIDLDETCRPYETFRMSRFGVRMEDIEALIQLAEDCAEIQKLKDGEAEEIVRKEFEVIEN